MKRVREGVLRVNRAYLSSVNRELITSPIFYVNAGHLYTVLLCDTMKRWKELNGFHPQFSTGTDEHGLKIQEAAAKTSTPPLAFCTNVSSRFHSLFQLAMISHTDYIRTTEPRHHQTVEHFWNRIHANGWIYKGCHEGWYCVSDETFVPISQVERVLRDGCEVVVGKESGKRVVWMKEENYKFRLSHFKPLIRDWLIKCATLVITPVSRYNDILKSLDPTHEEYQHDLSVSRPLSRVSWGIPVPQDPTHVIYVWLDALANYLTVSDYPLQPQPLLTHVIGKDIIKFV